VRASCRRNSGELTASGLSAARLLVLGVPNEPYTPAELEAMRTFVAAGGSLLALSGDGGDERRGSNLNAVVEPYGLAFESDSVLRTAYHSSPYLHPKDCLITHPVVPATLEAAVKRFVLRGSGKGAGAAAGSSSKAEADAETRRLELRMAYPRGCTVRVAEDEEDEEDDGTGAAIAAAARRRREQPAPTVVLTSGYVAYPLNQPVAAAFEARHDPAAALAMAAGAAAASASASAASPAKSARREGGRVVAVGSGEWLSSKWLGKEHNSAIADAIVRWLLRDDAVVIRSDPEGESHDGDSAPPPP